MSEPLQRTGQALPKAEVPTSREAMLVAGEVFEAGHTEFAVIERDGELMVAVPQQVVEEASEKRCRAEIARLKAGAAACDSPLDAEAAIKLAESMEKLLLAATSGEYELQQTALGALQTMICSLGSEENAARRNTQREMFYSAGPAILIILIAEHEEMVLATIRRCLLSGEAGREPRPSRVLARVTLSSERNTARKVWLLKKKELARRLYPAQGSPGGWDNVNLEECLVGVVSKVSNWSQHSKLMAGCVDEETRRRKRRRRLSRIEVESCTRSTRGNRNTVCEFLRKRNLQQNLNAIGNAAICKAPRETQKVLQ